MKLNVLTGTIPGKIRIIGNQDTEILNICADSRKVQAGDIFICTPGLRMDAHDFAPQAVQGGAVALLVDHELDIDVPQVIVEDVPSFKNFGWEGSVKARYIRYKAHRSKFSGFLFIDEIVVR